MKTRLITALVILAIYVPAFIVGGLFLDVVLVLSAIIATWEFYRMFKKDKLNNFILVLLELFTGGFYFTLKQYVSGDLVVDYVFALLFMFVITGALLLVFFEDFDADDFGHTFVSVFYPVFGFASLAFLRGLDGGLLIIGFLFMITTMTDTFAYVFGVRFGKHRLAEKISPKKSVEGSVYGSLSAVVLTIAYVYFTGLESIGSIELSIVVSIVLILVLSTIGQIGDLTASKMKRDYQIKDYSNLFPGHGGIMDRFDSVSLAAMVLLFVMMVVDVL